MKAAAGGPYTGVACPNQSSYIYICIYIYIYIFRGRTREPHEKMTAEMYIYIYVYAGRRFCPFFRREQMTCALKNDLCVDAFCVPDPNESKAAVSSLLMLFVCIHDLYIYIYKGSCT